MSRRCALLAYIDPHAAELDGGGVVTFGDPAGTVEQAWAVLRTGITDTAPKGPADPAAHSFESAAGFEFSR